MGICDICKSTANKKNIEGILPSELLEKTNLSYMEKYIYKINGTTIGSGFFCEIEFNNKKIPVLITNYHVIDDEFLEKYKYIKVDIKNGFHMININKDRKLYSSTKDKYDIMIVKISKDDVNIINYLQIDSNIYKTDSLSKYENEDLYLLHYPNSKSAHISYGKGIKQIGEYDIKHKCNTDVGSSGAPILSSSTNKVIGIHKGYINNGSETYNIGTFLKYPLDELNKKLIDDSKNNYIVAELCIKEEEINRDIRILNSYEEYMRENLSVFNLKEEYMNEKDINKCLIKINEETIPFTYYHKFKAKGNYTIKYSFMNYLTKTNQMFSGCSSLGYINLSNFNSENVTNMREMFSGCSSLIYVDLSKFNTKNVTDMEGVFSYCSSLKNLGLSNFLTQNVIIMNSMFEECSSLVNIDLDSFNTENVTEMICMFFNCSSLTCLNLSNFNTKNVTNMNGMFLRCSSLIDLDIHNFNTENVNSMYHMFGGCSSLININISSFRTRNVNTMIGMFSGCSSLISLDLSHFNTENLCFMSDMFSGCSSLKNLNLSNFNTRNVFCLCNIFNGCSSLKIENITSTDLRIFQAFKSFHFHFH